MSDGDQEPPSDSEVVRTAAAAAERVIFSRIDRVEVEDVDVTVSFEDRRLDVDVYLHAPDALVDTQQVADDAALAARAAVDELLE